MEPSVRGMLDISRSCGRVGEAGGDGEDVDAEEDAEGEESRVSEECEKIELHVERALWFTGHLSSV